MSPFETDPGPTAAQAASFPAGWIIDGTGGPALRAVVLQVEAGRIRSVDPVGRPPGRAETHAHPTIDLSHCTLIPALVDSHVHLFMSGTPDPEVRNRQLRATFEELRGVMAGHVRRQFEHGVLAVRDGGDYGGHGLRFRNECLDGDPPVILRCPGRAWRAAGRYGSLIGRPPEEGVSLDGAVARDLDRSPAGRCLPGGPDADAERGLPRDPGPDHVKIVQSGLNSLLRFGRETPPQFPLEELAAAVRAARRAGRPTMAHANGRDPVRLALEAGCLSVEHGFFMGRDNLERMAGRPVIWVPTVFTMEAYAQTLERGSRQAEIARRTLEHQLEQLSLARALGVTVAAGTDCGSLGVDHGAALREEIRLLCTAGYTVEEAVRCATANGARLLGLEEEMGTLLPGRPATFLAVPAPPEALPGALARLEGVYVRGMPVSLTARSGPG